MSAITDLFSHKIHASSSGWPDKLVELAFIFSEFDKQIYDRDRIVARLQEISPRTDQASRDSSKFRDEYSAYPAYFGLYTLRLSQGEWHISINETTQQLLLGEEPNVAGFLRLQLTLFQYPNAMGAIHDKKYEKKLKIQANARDKTLSMIRQGIRFSPLRLISNMLIADANLKNTDLLDAKVTFEEIYALCNSPEVIAAITPSQDSIVESLKQVRDGDLLPPSKFERRFHLLNHLGLFEVTQNRVSLRRSVSTLDQNDIVKKVQTIASVETLFEGFDNISSGEDLEQVILRGEWSEYFDAVRTLDKETIGILSDDWLSRASTILPSEHIDEGVTISSNNLYPLRPREDSLSTTPNLNTNSYVPIDPEVTRIKRQRSNLEHKIMLRNIDDLLRSLGAQPQENPHIDLYVEIPNDGSFIFEIKSKGTNLLSQIRKGVSQLYEYRFRYKDTLRNDVELCLVLPDKPTLIPWIEEYLCSDRGICLCWITESGEFGYSELCADKVSHLVAPKV